MTTEFEGEPVTGGTLPALIWKEFVSSYVKAQDAKNEDVDRSFDAAPYIGCVVVPGREARRHVEARQRLLPRHARGRLLLRPRTRGVRRLQAERGRRAARRRNDGGRGCRTPREPASRTRSSCTSRREPGSTPGAVVNQIPRKGGLSAGDEVTLVVSKARYGLLPNFVGSSLATVGPELTAAQAPRGASSPHMATRRPFSDSAPLPGSPPHPASRSRSWSGTADEPRALERVSPRIVLARADPDARAAHDLDVPVRPHEAKREPVERRTVVVPGDAESLRETTRARARGARGRPPHAVDASRLCLRSARAHAGARRLPMPSARRRRSHTSGRRTSGRRRAFPAARTSPRSGASGR